MVVHTSRRPIGQKLARRWTGGVQCHWNRTSRRADRMTSHVATVDWSFADRRQPSSATSEGLARSVLVGPAQGAVHTELAVGALAPGGWLNRHFHSFEEALYVLAGELLLEIDGRVHRLVAGDFGLMPVGIWHALANAGSEQTRWLSV